MSKKYLSINQSFKIKLKLIKNIIKLNTKNKLIYRKRNKLIIDLK